MKTAGIILIVLGVLALVYGGFTFQEKKQDAQLGPIQISHTEDHPVPIPPVVGGVLIVAGIGSLVASGRSKL
jgi:hypothetical protein